MNSFNLTPPLSVHCPHDKERSVLLFVSDGCFCPSGPSRAVRNSTMCYKHPLLPQTYLQVQLMWCRCPVTVGNIRSCLTDGSNYGCQSNVGQLQCDRGAGQLKCQGDVVLITILSAWLQPHVKPNVLPVMYWQPVMLHNYHRTQRPGLIRARGGVSPVSVEPVHPNNQCNSWSGALKFTCRCVSEAQIKCDRCQDAIKMEANYESGDGACR